MTTVAARPEDVHGFEGDDTAEPCERVFRDATTARVVEELLTCTSEAEERHLREQLVAVNMPIATTLARRYRHRGESDEDLEQVAFLGLAHAARRFDPHAGTPFSGFCIPTVLGELRRHFRDRGWVVRPPRSLQELQRLVRRAQAELHLTLNRSATVAEIATYVGRDFDEVEEALALGSCYTPTSLDRPVTQDGDSLPLGELLPVWDDGQRASEARVLLAPALNELSPRDKRIVHLRFFGGMTQREIAEDIGVTQMQVSRVLTRIFADLREAIGATD